MSSLVYFIIHVIFSVIFVNEAARILAVFPTPSISHQVAFRPLTLELAKRGHEVVVVTTDPAFPKGEAPGNLTEIDVHDISYKVWREHFLATATGNRNDIYTQMKVAFDLLTIIFEKQLQTEEFRKIIQNKSESFDLVLVEACVRPALAMHHVFKVPVIQVSSLGPIFGSYEIIGAPTHPILYPSVVRQKLYELTFWEKISELYDHYSLEWLIMNHENVENEMLQRNFPNIPTLSELSNNVHMLFLNVHPIWEDNHPVPPTVIFMGGVHQKSPKELPKTLKNYLDASDNGVIYMSFGTNTNPSALPPEKIQAFVGVFAKLPYNVLWKWDKDSLPGQSENIKISKWFPQSDILRHPKVKLFITQGGLQSTDEAITAGVPLIGIPILGDQWYNVEKYVHHKIGLRLDLDAVTEDTFRDAINSVIEDKSYRNNIAKLRSIMQDQPQPPLERAVWWTEYVLRHRGAYHLRSPAANISWTDYLLLDIVIPVALFIVTIFIVLCVVSIYIFNFTSSYWKNCVNVKVKGS